jgi:membrane dipeptidase
MNRIGMLVDITHVSPATMHAALDVSRVPVIFSHSSCRALTDHVRDVPDSALERLAGNGGIVMITFVPDFVSQACADRAAAEDAERHRLGLDKVTIYTEHAGEHLDPAAVAELDTWRARHPEPAATLAQVADHIEHAREVAGVGHIGLGGDYDGTESLPVGLEDVSTYPALLAELADRGWSDADLAKLSSGNILRVLQAAEDFADPGFGA